MQYLTSVREIILDSAAWFETLSARELQSILSSIGQQISHFKIDSNVSLRRDARQIISSSLCPTTLRYLSLQRTNVTEIFSSTHYPNLQTLHCTGAVEYLHEIARATGALKSLRIHLAQDCPSEDTLPALSGLIRANPQLFELDFGFRTGPLPHNSATVSAIWRMVQQCALCSSFVPTFSIAGLTKVEELLLMPLERISLHDFHLLDCAIQLPIDLDLPVEVVLFLLRRESPRRALALLLEQLCHPDAQMTAGMDVALHTLRQRAIEDGEAESENVCFWVPLFLAFYLKEHTRRLEKYATEASEFLEKQLSAGRDLPVRCSRTARLPLAVQLFLAGHPRLRTLSGLEGVVLSSRVPLRGIIYREVASAVLSHPGYSPTALLKAPQRVLEVIMLAIGKPVAHKRLRQPVLDSLRVAGENKLCCHVDPSSQFFPPICEAETTSFLEGYGDDFFEAAFLFFRSFSQPWILLEIGTFIRLLYSRARNFDLLSALCRLQELPESFSYSFWVGVLCTVAAFPQDISGIVFAAKRMFPPQSDEIGSLLTASDAALQSMRFDIKLVRQVHALL